MSFCLNTNNPKGNARLWILPFFFPEPFKVITFKTINIKSLSVAKWGTTMLIMPLCLWQPGVHAIRPWSHISRSLWGIFLKVLQKCQLRQKDELMRSWRLKNKVTAASCGPHFRAWSKLQSKPLRICFDQKPLTFGGQSHCDLKSFERDRTFFLINFGTNLHVDLDWLNFGGSLRPYVLWGHT